MTGNLPTLPTIGAIAERFGVTEREVDRAIRARSIKPVARAGIARVFSLEAVEQIRQELASGRGATADDPFCRSPPSQ